MKEAVYNKCSHLQAKRRTNLPRKRPRYLQEWEDSVDVCNLAKALIDLLEGKRQMISDPNLHY